MFKEFSKLGYEPKFFFNDDDSNIFNYFEDYLKTGDHYFEIASTQYLSVIAPGGSLSDEQIKSLKIRFRELGSGIYAKRFDRIDNIIYEWINSDSYNCELYHIEYFKNIDNGRLWIGYTDSFPNGGFFVNEIFDESLVSY